jgi:recombinational DNA repair protein RecR
MRVTTKRAPKLTKYERQMRAALREVIRIYEDDHTSCRDCGEFNGETHNEVCIVTMVRSALRRPA